MTEQEQTELRLAAAELQGAIVNMRAHNTQARRDKEMIPAVFIASITQSLMRLEVMCARPVEQAKPKSYRSMSKGARQ